MLLINATIDANKSTKSAYAYATIKKAIRENLTLNKKMKYKNF